MNETKPSDTKPKKMVRRSVAFALGMVCIGLVACLAGTALVLKNLQNQLNDLNEIVNGEKTVSEVWLSNKTFSLSPNDNASEWFYTPHSGDLEVEGYMEPANPNIWVNVSWSVYYGMPPRLYQVYPTPFIDNANYYYVEEEFPVVSFGQGARTPNVGITIGNNSTDTVTTVNVTITLYY